MLSSKPDGAALADPAREQKPKLEGEFAAALISALAR
jgi:hypothetical protein